MGAECAAGVGTAGGESEDGKMTHNEHCPGIDIHAGIKQFAGNEELYMSILEYYVEDMRPLLELVKSVGKESLGSYAQAAHAIKGTSRNVFANDLGDVAEEMEHAARNGDLAYVEEHYQEFYDQASTLVQNVEKMLASQ